MSQKKVEFISKVKFQQNKTSSATFTDEENMIFSNNILNTAINAGDVIVDADMPTEFLGATVDWTVGPPDDLTIEINAGSNIRYSLFQDLTLPNTSSTYSDDFKFKITTTGASEDFTFPSEASHIIDAIIDWGDNSSDDITTYDDGNLVHTYADAGDYDIHITGACEYFDLSSNTQIQELKEMLSARHLKTVKFQSCSNLSNIDASWKNISKVTDVSYMFYNCPITNIPDNLFNNCSGITDFLFTFAGSNITSIPTDLFKYNTLASSFKNTFYNTDITAIPIDLFRYNTLVNTFEDTFKICYSLSSVPSGLFDYNTEVNTFNNVLSNTDITEIPSGLFDNNTLVTDFGQAFYNCTSLTEIPSGLFDENTLVTDFDLVFYSCTSLTEIPSGLFNKNTIATSFNQAFQFCNLLTEIPSGLFDENTLATSLYSVFANTSITTIPDNLFDNNTLVTNFGQIFYSTDITSIPVDLFRYNTAITALSSSFGSCTSLTSIPTDIFKYNTAITSGFTSVFKYCISLKEVPVDIFRYNTAITTFAESFQGCTSLAKVPAETFDYNTAANNFSNTFNGCTSLAGTVLGTNELQYNMAALSPTTTTDAFTNTTGLIDYDLIPAAWGGPGLAALTNYMEFLVEINSEVGYDYTLPINNIANANMDVVVDWGDASGTDHITDYTDTAAIHHYAGASTFTIKITGQMKWLDFTGDTDLKTIGTANRDIGLETLKFYGCTNLTTVLANGLGKQRSLTSYHQLFTGCTSLNNIVDDMFGSYDVTSFYRTFDGCNALPSIPAGLFDNSPEAFDLYGLFQACTNITTIPVDLFKYNTKVITFKTAFSNSGITTIPVDLFKYNTAVTNFYGVFSYSDITAIPVDLFRYNTAAASFSTVFMNCTSLVTIPTDLFRYNTIATSFGYAFYGCDLLTSIPTDLFRYNTIANDFIAAFNGSGLTTIPTDLILYNTLAEYLSNMFKNCNSITTAVTGVNDFIGQAETNATNETITLTKSGCFDGCTSISDYASISTGAGDWRTV